MKTSRRGVFKIGLGAALAGAGLVKGLASGVGGQERGAGDGTAATAKGLEPKADLPELLDKTPDMNLFLLPEQGFSSHLSFTYGSSNRWYKRRARDARGRFVKASSVNDADVWEVTHTWEPDGD